MTGPVGPAAEECLKLTTYFGERDRTRGRLLADALLDLYGEHSLLSSVLLRGVEGFGAPHHLSTDRLLSLSEDLPVVSIAIDTRERIEAVLAAVLSIQRRGLFTLERARLIAPDFRPPLTESDQDGKLTVYVGRHQRVGRVPAWLALVDLLHGRGVAGATVLLGVDGTRHGKRCRAGFLASNLEVPAMVLAVGPIGPIVEVLPEIRRAVPEPLITLERVKVCKRDGQLLSDPHELPSTDARGVALWQKLTVYTSQAATYEGHPLSLRIVRGLRASGAAGATSLRGTWGFHGAHAPHGDRFLQLRRHVPVLTVAIDTPERIASAFEVIDKLTANEGLVTSEMVPALSVASAQAELGAVELASLD